MMIVESLVVLLTQKTIKKTEAHNTNNKEMRFKICVLCGTFKLSL